MLVESIVANLYEPSTHPHGDVEVDWVDFRWDECHRRALRKQSRGGRDLRVLLPIGQHIRHGDLLGRWPDTQQYLAAYVLPTDVLVGRPTSASLFAKLAYELGNLHVPVEIHATEILTPPDGPVEAAFARVGVACVREVRRFTPDRADVPQVSRSSALQVVRLS